MEIDVTDARRLRDVLKDSYAVLSAVPFNLTGNIAVAAKETGARYLDLTEDVATTRRVRQLAADARTAFIPQCGLAPGFITIVAYDLIRRFAENCSSTRSTRSSSATSHLLKHTT